MRPYLQALLEQKLGAWAAVLVPSYVAMLVLGCLLAAVLIVDEARRQGYAPRDTLLVLMVGYVGGLAGAAAVPLVQALGAWVFEGRFHFKSGFAAYGGLLGGVTAGTVALRRLRRPVLPFLDAAAPAMPLAYFFARLGCLLAGCDYGLPSTLPGALRYPPGSYAYLDHVQHGWISPGAPHSLAVYPTQLYMSFAGLLLFLVLRRLPARGDGRRFLTFVVGYAVLRSLIELLRGDAGRGWIGPLSTSQFLAAVSVLLAIVLWRAEGKRNRDSRTPAAA